MSPNKPQIEIVGVERLIPYARNSRTHDDAQVAQIAASIREFGFTNPVLIDADHGIIAGHGRVMAARKLGLAEVPCIRLGYLTEIQKRAYVIADNKLALNAGWDEEALRLELGDLRAADVDLSLTGFAPDEIADLLAEKTEGETDPDEVPEPPVDPVSVLGDVWVLGKHRIACGDCTEQGVVDRALNGAKPHLMVTDPPYGVEYDASWRKDAMPDTNPGKTGGMHGKVKNDDRADWREAWALFSGDVAYVWHAGNMAHIVAESLLSCELGIRAQIIWAKHQFVIGRGDYHPHHEPCWYAVRKGKVGHYNGDRTQSTLWQIDKPQKSETGHSTQKPIECMKRPIENNSAPGDHVYEPFSGSGTTIIAGEMTGRHVHAIELNPAYVDIAVKRWQDFTSQQAIHEPTGKTFNDLSAEKIKR
jgi:DNA modification methylase